jgi:hypothetical protein
VTVATSLRSWSGRGRQPAAGGVHHAHRVFDRDELLRAAAHVPFGPAETRQQQRLPAVEQVRAVQLGGDLDGECAVAHRLLDDGRVRRRGHEVAAQRHEDVHLAVAHGPDRVDGGPAVLPGRFEAELVTQRVQEPIGHLLARCPSCGRLGRLLCPRIGDGPAPGRPMLPRSSRKLTISRIEATALRCWVRPMAQQTMTLRAAATSPANSVDICGPGEAALGPHWWSPSLMRPATPAAGRRRRAVVLTSSMNSVV